MSEADEVEAENLINQLRNIEPEEFEELISNLWEYLGYNTEVTQSSRDRGIDVTATKEFPYEEKILIQAKRYTSTLSGPELREYGVLTKRDGVDSVIVISTSGFTKQAKQEAEEYEIKLIDGSALAQMLIDEDVVDLAREFTGEIEAADISPKRASTQPASTKQESQTTTGEGEFLTIEIAGYDHKEVDFLKTNTSGMSTNVYYDAKECTVICLHIRNKSDSLWRLRPRDTLSITSKDGFSHNNAIPCPNSNQEKNLSPWNNGNKHDINRDSKSRVVLFYMSKFVPEKIEYTAELLFSHDGISGSDNRTSDKEKITVHIDENIRNDINSLPESLPVDSVALRS